jgi:hypothetical protein
MLKQIISAGSVTHKSQKVTDFRSSLRLARGLRKVEANDTRCFFEEVPEDLAQEDLSRPSKMEIDLAIQILSSFNGAPFASFA